MYLYVFQVLWSTRTETDCYIERICNYPRRLEDLAHRIRQPGFPNALHKFLYLEGHPEAIDIPPYFTPPPFEAGIRVHHSATATFYAPFDLCGTGGLLQERIQSMPYCHGGTQFLLSLTHRNLVFWAWWWHGSYYSFHLNIDRRPILVH